MRLFNVLRNILKTMGRKEMYVFIDGTSLCDPEWLAVGPHEDPHTYPTLEQLAFYQADPILERGSKVYLLFPVPDEVLRPILEKYEADRE